MRLIDASRIDRNQVKVFDYQTQKWVLIKDLPTVEVAAAVRCKDCRFATIHKSVLVPDPFVSCEIRGNGLYLDDYCSKGEANG